jgi:hypothetical protein
MNLSPFDLPEENAPENFYQLVCRNCLKALKPESVYHAAQLADLGWSEHTDKYAAFESFLNYHKVGLKDLKICEILMRAIEQRAKGCVK